VTAPRVIRRARARNNAFRKATSKAPSVNEASSMTVRRKKVRGQRPRRGTSVDWGPTRLA
jgi:hypothetical protein